jgi:hypothetical protein
MIDGAGYSWTNVKGNQQQIPNYNGEYFSLGQGNIGNGYGRITLINSFYYNSNENQNFIIFPHLFSNFLHIFIS